MTVIKIQTLFALIGNEHPNTKGVHFCYRGFKHNACILLFKQLDQLEFGGESPLTMRTRCSAFRYCPNPLGIVTAEQLGKLEFIVLTKIVRGFFRDDILSKPFCLSPK